MKFNTLTLLGILYCSFILLAFVVVDDQAKPWDAPPKYEKMENPNTADKASLKIGKRLYNKHCKSCHGSEGLGDGSKAAKLDTPCGDFTAESFITQTDGSLFYKSKFGRDEMPNYEKKIPYDEDIWHLVNYMRTFSE